MRVKPEDFILTDIDPAQFVRQTVDDAARFHETQLIFNDWFGKQHIYLAQVRTGNWKVLADTAQVVGKWVIQQDFPTYAQALAFALDEAQRRISEA